MHPVVKHFKRIKPEPKQDDIPKCVRCGTPLPGPRKLIALCRYCVKEIIGGED